jgi:peptidyl-prolyl cis-trans isomerase SurA
MNLKGIIAASVLFISTAIVAFAQNETLLTIGGESIPVDEFMHIYKKNNSNEFETKKAKDYMDLFVNFKLKVIEAESLKMDTAADFKNELAGYRDQLAKPYMIENQIIEKLAKEAYERSKTEVKLDHILVKISKNADPKDTLIAHSKAINIVQRIKNGEDFEKVARETSDDRSVGRTGGHLWYMPISTMPYSLQKFASSAKINDLSNPIHSQFGYHIIRILEKRPAHDQVKVAHIMIAAPENLTDGEKALKKVKIDSIYQELRNKKDFAELAKLSDDKGSATQGGELPWFGTGRMVPEFEKVAFELKNKGDYSMPVKTSFGWHIIKLIDNKPIATYQEEEKNLKSAVEKDEIREILVENFVMSNLKNSLHFKQITEPSAFYIFVDSTVYNAAWNAEKTAGAQNVLFTIGKGNFTEKDFAQFIESSQVKSKPIPINVYVDEKYSDFVYQSLENIEKNDLEKTNSDFKYLMQEYHDGILLFDLTDKMVWSKAVKDSLGLREFYEKNKENYRVQTKADLSIFNYSDKKTLKNAEKLLNNKIDKNLTDEQIVKEISGGVKEKFQLIYSGLYSKNDNPSADKVIIGLKDGSIKKNQKIVVYPETQTIVFINKIEDSEGKPFEEIKGIVISDYQNLLEEKWIESLKKKYPVKINEAVLNKIN